MLLPRPVLIVAPPESRRVRAFQATLHQLDWPEARVVSYQDVLQEKVDFAALVTPETLVRIESPGESLQTERDLLRLGLEGLETGMDPDSLALEEGQIMPSGQWYDGLKRFFEVLETQLQACPAHQRTLDFQEALQLFDKRITSRKWQEAGVPVPAPLREPQSFEDLLSEMQGNNLQRVFVKLAHGSSASGALALHVSGRKIRAITTVRREGERLFNSRQLLHLSDRSEIAQTVNLLCQHPLQVEAWIPKATFQGKTIDLRVVVVGGVPMHALVRLGQGAMTNLHLGNSRGDMDALKAHMGEHWDSIEASCQRAMQVFPRSLYAGLDVLIRPNLSKHHVLEANTFGDYHRNVFYRGMDTFTAQLWTLQERRTC